MAMSAVMKDDIKQDVGRYIEERLASTGVSHVLKNELSQDLAQYV
jgi:hypothetical protein